MQKTIQTVDPATRTWTPKDGSYTLTFIEGQFTDGTSWSYATKPESAGKRMQELQSLVGVESDFTLEAKGEFQGRQQFKLKDYPGKPQPRGGFGGGGLNSEQIELLAQRVAEQVVQMLNGAPAPAPAATPKALGGVSLKTVKQIKELAESAGISEEDLLVQAGVSESLMELTRTDADELLAALTATHLNN